jgi:hypothetical protein
MPEATQQLAVPQDAGEDPDTESEFKSLWTDATEGRARLAALAKSATDAGHPEIAKVYDEISETVMGLLVDLTMATGGAIMNAESDIQDLEEDVEDLEKDRPAGADASESALLPEDAEKYLQLFGQYMRLFDGLAEVIPAGPEGDQQRSVFATLRRMTEGMMEFTKSIIIEPEEEEPGEEEEEEPGA